MDVRRLFCRLIPSLIAGAFLFSACTVFSIKYLDPAAILLPYFDIREDINRMLFFINFYIPFGLASLALWGCLFRSGFFFRTFCVLIGFPSLIIAGYVLNDLFTINLCLYSAWVIIMVAAFSFPKNYIICGVSVFFFTLSLFRPSFLGSALGQLSFFEPDVTGIIILIVYLLCLAVAAASVRFLAEKCVNTEGTVSHLNLVGAKMLLFNHRLQEYVRNLGEEAVKKDRLRFTSELHDSCGYVFTNIMALCDAAISCGSMKRQKIEETFLLIRNQAGEGLRRTRETLHMIRELQDPGIGSIDTIYQMKSIFEEVTGIKVDIESGNMKYNYGSTVNRILTRIIQEAFTNSVRHGQATYIIIQFWEFPDSLSMTVSDNGVGAQHIVKGIGLAGMEERLAAIGGTIDAYSPEEGGFRLKINIPLIDVEYKTR